MFVKDRKKELSTPPCYFCKNFIGSGMDFRKCHAFPDGIPYAIWVAEHMHQTPYPGDNGIQFEVRDDAKHLDLSGCAAPDLEE